MHREPQPVIVIGAGVSGLSCAIRLAEDPARRFTVRILTQKPPRASLSRLAGAVFYPYAVDHPHLHRWLAAGLAEFRALAERPGSGVRMVAGAELFRRPAGESPFAGLLEDYRHAPPDPAWRVAPEYVDAYRFSTAVIEMPAYLAFLERRFLAAGGTIERVEFKTLDDALEPGAVHVHCTGILARRFVPDPRLRPTLGQLVRVARGPLDRFLLDEEDASRATYVVPRGDDCILGTIAEPWPADLRGFDPPPPHDEVTRDILERCARLDPRVREVPVLEAWCGLRPARDRVRLEVDAERLARGQRVIHDYGHGGAGVTLSWGCATEVVEKVEDLLDS